MQDTLPNPARRDSANARTPEIVVARGRFGLGYVIVRGFDQLRAQLDEQGFANVVQEKSNELFKVRRDGAGDLVRLLDRK
jgi:hypothetical protein